MELPLFESILPCPATEHFWAEIDPILFMLIIYLLLSIEKVPSQYALSQVK